MPDWKDPLEIARVSEAFQKIIFAFFGLYVWELFMTCDFEWSLLSGRRKFHWPLIFFFFCRYCMLFSFIGLIISLTAVSPINCRALYTFNSWTGNMAILCASTCLMLRTIALWERKLTIIIILGILCLAHWGLLYRTMFVISPRWDDGVKACIVQDTNAKLMNFTFIFTMAFDFIILVFTTVALVGRHPAKTAIWKMLFKDGLVYFLISFTMNCIPAVLNMLNLNSAMNVVATIPAATLTSIAACRAVIRLLEFHSNDLYVHTASLITSSHFGRPSIPVPPPPKPSKLQLTRPEVHVTTEHFTTGELPISGESSPYNHNHSQRSSFIQDSKVSDKDSILEFRT